MTKFTKIITATFWEPKNYVTQIISIHVYKRNKSFQKVKCIRAVYKIVIKTPNFWFIKA